MSNLKIAMLIPTRNRSDLAIRAIRSACAFKTPIVHIVVSDNSTQEQESVALVKAIGEMGGNVTYIKPQAPLEMSAHWDWAISETLSRLSPSHFSVLTDRMVFCNAESMKKLAQIVSDNPDDAVTYNIDFFNDIRPPYWLRKKHCLGATSLVQSSDFRDRSANAMVDHSLPRLLNSVVPVSKLLRVKEVFGNFCISLSPDYAFAYRYICVDDRCLTWDHAPLIQYSLDRSNGLSITRGKYESKDARDFIAQAGGQLQLRHTPFPELLVITNACLHEYGAVGAHPACKNFQPIKLPPYVRALCRDLALVEVDAVREHLIGCLSQRGHHAEWLKYGFPRFLRYRIKRWLSSNFASALFFWMKFIKGRRFYTSIDAVLIDQQTNGTPTHRT